MTARFTRSGLGGVLASVAVLVAATSALAQGPVVAPTAPNRTESPDLLPVPPNTPATPAPVEANPPPTPVAEPPPAAPKPTFEMNWKDGLFFETLDKRFSFHLGATIQYDFTWFSASPTLEGGIPPDKGIGKFNDGVNLRRGRIFAEGTLYSNVDYKFEVEFANGIGFSPAGTTNETTAGSITNSPGPTDAWMTIGDVPFFGNIRIGNQKEWFSLEHLNNYRALEFLERSYLFDLSQPTAFNNGFSPGVSAFRTWADERLFTGMGVYKNISDLLGFGLGDGQYAVGGRLAALPIWRPDNQIFWHVGGAMSHRDPVDNQTQVRIRDNIRNAPFPLLPLLVNTNLLDAESQDLYNFETAAVYGSWTFQAEYTANLMHNVRQAATATTPVGPPQGTIFFQGYYAEMMVFLTGESRTWNTKFYLFNRVNVLHPFRFKRDACEGRGFGAWELACRYTYLDASNKGIQAGRIDSVTLGINWYLNTNAKLQLNYDYTHVGDKSNSNQGHVNGVGIRSQFDF